MRSMPRFCRAGQTELQAFRCYALNVMHIWQTGADIGMELTMPFMLASAGQHILL